MSEFPLPESAFPSGPIPFLRAVAVMRGSPSYPAIRGTVRFLQLPGGVIVMAEIDGLPQTPAGFFGFHVHMGNCNPGIVPPGPGQDPFPASGGHYNPGNMPHPRHAGDFPPLLATSRGSARMNFVTDRFTLREIIGRAVIIHLQPDDLTTQPAGNSGPKIACGMVAAE